MFFPTALFSAALRFGRKDKKDTHIPHFPRGDRGGSPNTDEGLWNDVRRLDNVLSWESDTGTDIVMPCEEGNDEIRHPAGGLCYEPGVGH